jgi:hypothetical protein
MRSLGTDGNDNTYMELGNGILTLANDETVTEGITKIRFLTKFDGYSGEETSDIYMHGGQYSVVLYRPGPYFAPTIQLWHDHTFGETSRVLAAEYGGPFMRLILVPPDDTPYGDAMSFTASITTDAATFETWPNKRFLFQGDVETEDGDVKIQGAQRWIPDAFGEWPALPDAGPEERILVPDPTTGAPKWWNGTTWATVTTI